MSFTPLALSPPSSSLYWPSMNPRRGAWQARLSMSPCTRWTQSRQDCSLPRGFWRRGGSRACTRASALRSRGLRQEVQTWDFVQHVLIAVCTRCHQFLAVPRRHGRYAIVVCCCRPLRWYVPGWVDMQYVSVILYTEYVVVLIVSE